MIAVRRLAAYRAFVFTSLYAGYTLYVYLRKSFSFALPAVVSTEDMGKSRLGLIISSQSFAYAVSKFFSGFIVDVYSPKLLLQIGLLGAALSTIAFTYCSSIIALTFFWFVNGLFQGPGWSSCAKILIALGTWWSLLSTSMNVAGSLGPPVTMYVAMELGWRRAMLLPGILAVLVSMLLRISVHNKPSDCGLEDFQGKMKDDTDKKLAGGIIWKILCDPFLLLLGTNYMIVFFIRSSMVDWGQVYLVQEKHLNVASASFFTSSQEVGGILGSLIAGYISDKLQHKRIGSQQSNIRLKVACVFALGVVFFLYLLIFFVTQQSLQIWIIIVGFGLGFCLYGPISVFGVVAVEVVPKSLGGSTHSVVSVFSNIGAVMAGFPLTYLAVCYGWQSAFVLLNLLAVAVMLMLWKNSSLQCGICKTNLKQN